MKIALLVSSLDEGTETFVKRHIELLGKDIVVIFGALTPFKTKERDDSENFGIKLYWKLLKLLGNTDSFRCFLLKRHLRKHNITHCYAEFGPVGVGALAACKSENVKLLVNFHGYDAFRYDVVEKYREPYKDLFDYSEKVIGVSNSMIKQLIKLGCPQHKLVCAPCYPNPMFKNIQYEPTQKIICFVGRFVEKKAPWLTLLAFKKVLEKDEDAKLVMAGDGPYLAMCKSLVRALEITNVSFLGSVSHEQVERLLSSAMIYAQHSITAADGDREGTPVSVMEAMYAGIPVVSTKHEGIQDIIENNEYGLLGEEHDLQKMADSIIRLIENKALRQKISENSAQRIQSLTNKNNEFFSSILTN